MPISTDIKSEFLNIFIKVFDDKPLVNENKLNVFMLKLSNNQFDYNNLFEGLDNALITYALSRHTYKELITQKKFGTLSRMAREKLRRSQSNTGELGELLLYCLLESHLKAPKLLTKLELKTSPNDYVKGTDGVHLLKINNTSYQLVFGESKLYAKLKTGIIKAFDSIKTLIENDLSKIKYEIRLVNSNLLKETVLDESSYNILKKLLIPSDNDEDLNIDNSFGIFLGFDINISDDERRENNEKFRINIFEKLKSHINEIIPSINEQLKKNEFIGYNFYIYIMPFSELKKVRVDIIKKLKNN